MDVDDRRIYVTGAGADRTPAGRNAGGARRHVRSSTCGSTTKRCAASRPRARTGRRVCAICRRRDAAAIATAFRRRPESVADLVFNSAGTLARGRSPTSRGRLRTGGAREPFGSRNVAAAALPLLGREQLVFVASMAAVAPGYGYTAYGSSKAGVFGFAEALRSELAPRGIDVAVVCPPEVATPLVAWSRTVRPAPTERLTRFAGSLGVDEACEAILAGILGRRILVIPGRRANFAYLLSRLLPKRVTHAIADRIVAQALAVIARVAGTAARLAGLPPTCSQRDCSRRIAAADDGLAAAPATSILAGESTAAALPAVARAEAPCVIASAAANSCRPEVAGRPWRVWSGSSGPHGWSERSQCRHCRGAAKLTAPDEPTRYERSHCRAVVGMKPGCVETIAPHAAMARSPGARDGVLMVAWGARTAASARPARPQRS
jgi:NAD(P)-dependent dehydrogenase (short-subunit alcohol dehydrogenase family)